MKSYHRHTQAASFLRKAQPGTAGVPPTFFRPLEERVKNKIDKLPAGRRRSQGGLGTRGLYGEPGLVDVEERGGAILTRRS
jgi:hypothetical protein